MDAKLRQEIVKDLFELSALEYDRFKKGAYYRAALNLKNSDEENYLKIKGVGKKIGLKIGERIKTGKIKKLEEYRKERAEQKKDNKYITLEEAQIISKELLNGIDMKHDICGSFKRKKAKVSDLDILILKKDMNKWKEHFMRNFDITIVAAGKSSFDFRYKDVLINLRSTEESGWGAGQLYLTGPQLYSIYIRSIANTFGYKLNQYGLFIRSTDEKIAGEDEKGIFEKIGVEYINPEDRN